jgi:hypothetical protein
MLVEEMVLTAELDETVGVVHPVPRWEEVVCRTMRIADQRL